MDVNQHQISNPAIVIELYKLEVGTSCRSFSIPAGSCNSVNIPIQITSDGARVPVYSVAIPSGYLQPGEYAFIDKSSLNTDGSALVCFAFTVKQ
jgi:hypothetical protein